MKYTKKQLQEIDFFEIVWWFISTADEVLEYINLTSYWIWDKKSPRDENNRLIIQKRKFDITLKLWAEDMKDWILLYSDILEDYNHHPYVVKVLDSIRKSLVAKPSYNWIHKLATVWFLNSKYNNEQNINNALTYIEYYTKEIWN